MRYKIILICLFIILFNITDAQKKSMVTVSFGLATPLGSFAQKDTNSVFTRGVRNGTILNSGSGSANTNDSGLIATNGKGLAKTGINLSIDYQYLLKKRYGLIVRLRGQQNSVDANYVANLIKHDESQYSTVEAMVKIEKWVSGSILAGLFYQVPLSVKTSRLEMQLKLMGGILKTRIPERSSWTYILNNTSSIVATNFNPSQSLNWAFSYSTGIGLLYHLSNKITVNSNLDYSNSLLHITYHPIIIVNNIAQVADPYTIHFGMSTLNLNIGAGIRF